MNVKKRIFVTMGLFLLMVSAYGAVIAFASGLLRSHGIDSPFIKALLIGSTVFVYYRLWRRLCVSLDKIGKSGKSTTDR